MLTFMKRTTLGITLVGSLLLGALLVLPASQAAAATGPTITVSQIQYGVLQVSGSGFTSGGLVRVSVISPNGFIADTVTTTASQPHVVHICNLRICWTGTIPGGQISQSLSFSVCGATIGPAWEIIATDLSSGRYSNPAWFYPAVAC
jgi:hypothetical protein